MDVANLISPPGPLPTYKSAGDDKSYFTAVPAFYSRSPQPPLSPPVEDQPKCSLPSISTLFEGADSAAAQPASMSISITCIGRNEEVANKAPAERQRISSPDSRPQSRAYEPVMAGVPVCLPPTPPLRPGSSFHRASSHSPSASSASVTSDKGQGHFYQKPQIPLAADRSSISSQGSAQAGPYASPAPSVASYSSPVESAVPATVTTPTSATATTMYYQRPTAMAAPPTAATAIPAPAAPTPAAAAAAAAAHQQMISPVTPAWQHHHYFPPSNSTPYQQNHDRYICRTCHKAFSRPSSLRIHSHSHTGEKPFRCTHAGCGKAFSVRSNMKRHERGCHTGRPVATAVV